MKKESEKIRIKPEHCVVYNFYDDKVLKKIHLIYTPTCCYLFFNGEYIMDNDMEIEIIPLLTTLRDGYTLSPNCKIYLTYDKFDVIGEQRAKGIDVERLEEVPDYEELLWEER